MYIKDLELRNYRNYNDLKIRFDRKITVIYGKNGQGKSNILEAIYFLSALKSQRARERKELVAWGQPEALVKAGMGNRGRDEEIAALIGERGQIVLKENKVKKRLKERRSIPVVLFTPDDLQIVKGSPQKRRSYLDTLICQTKTPFTKITVDYFKVLVQRNAYLKRNKYKDWDVNLIDVWDNKLIALGSRIIEERKKILETVGPKAREIYQKLTGEGRDIIDIKYKSQVEGKGEEQIREELRAALALRKGEERERGTTLVGPHRDDFIVHINGKDAKAFASQGEERCIVLALKLSEIALFRKEKKEETIVLLDDVLSELDETRKEALFKSLKGKEQVIITTTSEKHIPPHVNRDAYKLFICEGRAFNVPKNECGHQGDHVLIEN